MYDGVGPKFWCIKKSSAVRWQDQKCGYMIPLSIECTSSWWWHDDGRHGDKHDLRIMVLINVFVVFENHKHGIVIVLLKNIQGQDNIENIWVKCLVKCTQANFEAKVQIDAFLHIKKIDFTKILKLDLQSHKIQSKNELLNRHKLTDCASVHIFLVWCAQHMDSVQKLNIDQLQLALRELHTSPLQLFKFNFGHFF